MLRNLSEQYDLDELIDVTLENFCIQAMHIKNNNLLTMREVNKDLEALGHKALEEAPKHDMLNILKSFKKDDN